MKNPLRVTVIDHRGKICPMVPLEIIAHFVEKSDRMRRLREANKGPFKTESWPKQVALFLLSITVCFSSVLAMIWLRTALALKPWQSVLMALIAGIFMSIVLIYLARLFAAKRVVQIYSTAGCCASCGYDLLNVAEDAVIADGCRICPECNSAWRIQSSSH